MSLDFAKQTQGSSLDFSKDLGVDLSKSNIIINLNWGVPAGRSSVDLDSNLATIVGGQKVMVEKKTGGILGFGSKTVTVEEERGKRLKGYAYYGNKDACRSDGVKHHGDDLTGASAEGEFIEIDGSKIGADVTELVPSLASFSGDDFSSLPFAYMRVYVGTTTKIEKPLFEVDLTDVKRGTRSAIFGKLVRDGQSWKWVTDTRYFKSGSNNMLREESAKL